MIRRPGCLAVVLLWLALPSHAAEPVAAPAAAVADEAVSAAMALPPGYKRDVVLRAVARNLGWFGQAEAGTRAARGMADGGASEIPASGVMSLPRYIPLRDAAPTRDPCDLGLWRNEKRGEAKTGSAREAWARRCLIERDFHWIGLPDLELVKRAAGELPPGQIKAAVLAMLIRSYGDVATLRFVSDEMGRHAAQLPAEARDALGRMLAEPAIAYRLGDKAAALRAAAVAPDFSQKAELLKLLIENGDTADALRIFETLGATPPEFADSCFGWLNPVTGLGLAYLGNPMEPVPAIGDFLDRLPASPFFAKICPGGMEPDMMVEHLLAAGRTDAAIERARPVSKTPFLLVGALFQAARAELRRGEVAKARAHAMEAGRVLPSFRPGDPIDPSGAVQPGHDFGERDGDTALRFQLIQLIAATGAPAEADALARAQPAGGLRAVALSAAVAGRAGLRFDDQAPILSTVGKFDLQPSAGSAP